jgi:hypothetical protein
MYWSCTRTESRRRKTPKANCGDRSASKAYCVLAVIAHRQIVERILDGISVFTKDRSQRDDVTLVVVAVQDEAGS